MDVNSKELFTLSQNTHLYGNKFKLVKPKSVSVRDDNFVISRVVSIWNSLPDSIVTVESVSSLKHRLNSRFVMQIYLLVMIFGTLCPIALLLLSPYLASFKHRLNNFDFSDYYIVVQGAYQRWHTMHSVFILYAIVSFILFVLFCQKQTNQQTFR
jgi:hypothetical protein